MIEEMRFDSWDVESTVSYPKPLKHSIINHNLITVPLETRSGRQNKTVPLLSRSSTDSLVQHQSYGDSTLFLFVLAAFSTGQLISIVVIVQLIKEHEILKPIITQENRDHLSHIQSPYP